MVLTALSCIALNVYFEARNENMSGQYAVALVVLNRVEDSRWPNEVCDVVTQRNDNNVCQFSWYCDGKSDTPKNKDAFAFAEMVADDVLRGEILDFTGGSTHYHAYYVKPYWADKMLYQGDYGSHYFFREIEGFPK